MAGPFKMKGFSGFGNSPMKQDKKMTKTVEPIERKGFTKTVKGIARKVEQGDKAKAKVTPQKEGFRLMAGQQVKGEPREYFKVYSGGRKVKISESEYNTSKDS